MRRPSQPIFYGWWIVAAGAVMSALVGGSVFYGLGAFFAPIQAQYHWSYATISWAFTLQSLVGGIGSIAAGWIFDRVGPSILVAAGVTLSGIGFVLLSRAANPAELYLAFIVMGIGTAGATFLVLNSLVTLWFHRNLGKALALLQTGYGVGGLTATGFVALILAVGWRSAALMIGVTVLVLGLPVSLVLRHTPASKGLKPDGAPARGPGPPQTGSYLEPAEDKGGLAASAVLRTPAFWIILVVFVLSSAVSYAVFAHQIRAMISFGVDAPTAGAAAGAASFVGLAGRYGFGWLAGMRNIRNLMALALGLQASGVLLLSQIKPSAGALVALYVVLFGIGQGGIFLLSPIIQREYFGTRSFGTIQGFLLGPSMVVSAAAPLLIGLLVDRYATYRPAFLLCGLMGIGLAGLILLSRIPVELGSLAKVSIAGMPAEQG